MLHGPAGATGNEALAGALAQAREEADETLSSLPDILRPTIQDLLEG